MQKGGKEAWCNVRFLPAQQYASLFGLLGVPGAHQLHTLPLFKWKAQKAQPELCIGVKSQGGVIG